LALKLPSASVVAVCWLLLRSTLTNSTLARLIALRSPSTSRPATLWFSRSSEAKCGPENFGAGFSVVPRRDADGASGMGGGLLSFVPGGAGGRKRSSRRSFEPGAGAGTASPGPGTVPLPVGQQVGWGWQHVVTGS